MQKILYFILITTSLLVPKYVDAQSKPKRDVSKDRSVIVAKQKKEAQEKKAQETAKKQTTRRKKITRPNPTPKRATYLKVNELMFIDRNINSKGGYETFSINTDGENWNVYSLPSWCHITKYYKSFRITYDANTSHDDRKDWFIVRSDNQEVKVNIIQAGAPLYISASFTYGQLKHNVYASRYGRREQCLNISANVTISGAKQQKLLVAAFIVDEDNKNIKASYGYSDFALIPDKEVYAVTEITPYYDDAQRFSVDLYLPNDAMNLLKKNNKLQVKLALFCVKTSSYVSGANYTLRFKAKNKKGKVTTKDY